MVYNQSRLFMWFFLRFYVLSQGFILSKRLWTLTILRDFNENNRFKSHSQTSAAFRFNKPAKNVKIMGPKTEKNLFSLLKLSKKYRKMLDRRTRYSLNFFKFESLNIAYRMLRLRLLHSIFKALLLRHTINTLTKLLIKLNRIYASYVPKVFWNFFHRLRKSKVTFVTG